MELVYAGIIVFVVILVYFLVGEKRIKKTGKRAQKFLTWMNVDMITSVFVFIFCAWVWLKFNLDNGNVMALSAGIEILNELSNTGITVPSLTTLRIAGAIPSVIEWWLLQFHPEGSTRYTIGWLIIGLDVLLTTIGYWFAAGLTTNPWELTLLHRHACVPPNRRHSVSDHINDCECLHRTHRTRLRPQGSTLRLTLLAHVARDQRQRRINIGISIKWTNLSTRIKDR